jgi:hypothetical protein
MNASAAMGTTSKHESGKLQGSGGQVGNRTPRDRERRPESGRPLAVPYRLPTPRLPHDHDSPRSSPCQLVRPVRKKRLTLVTHTGETLGAVSVDIIGKDGQ